MNYDARYEGELAIQPPLNPAEVKALNAFFGSRRITTTGGPLDSRRLEKSSAEVLDYGRPPEGQPGLYCNMKVSDDGTTWSENQDHEKPGDLTPWIEYVIQNLLQPGALFSTLIGEDVPEKDLLRQFTFDHVVNGQMHASTPQGETWTITVTDNAVAMEVTSAKAEVTE